MYLLDTDHWTVLQLQMGVEYDQVMERMSRVGRQNCYTSIITFHEVMNGWLKFIATPKNQKSVILAYSRFEELLRAFSLSQLITFSEKSADEFERQRSMGCRIGTMDLRIASIAISNGMVVVTRNAVDFEKVGGIEIQNWISDT